MLDMITDFIDYVRRGKIDQILVAASREDAEIARVVQNSIIEQGDSCRIVHQAEKVEFDNGEVVEIVPGTVVITTIYEGHLFTPSTVVSQVVKFQMEV